MAYPILFYGECVSLSHKPFPVIQFNHGKTLFGMEVCSLSICTFLASDHLLSTVSPAQDYPLEINMDHDTIYDGGADDNFFLHIFEDVTCYTNKKYGVSLEWYYTNGRANQILKYIKEALQDTDCIELWHVWLMDSYEYEDSPVIHNQTVSIDELTIEDIKEVDQAEIWNTPDKRYPKRPSFYCLTITR